MRGVGDACRGIGLGARKGAPLPVISGNVSFYNQSSSGRSVAPSPIVACVGLIEDYACCRTQRFKSPGDVIILVGRRGPETGGSLYLDAGFKAGRPAVAVLDIEAARAEIRVVIDLVRAGLPTAVHDISDGGLAGCLSEMAMAQEGAAVLGAKLAVPGDGGLSLREFLFGEAGGFVLTVPVPQLEVAAGLLDQAGVVWDRLGEVTGEPILTMVDGRGQTVVMLDVADMTRSWQQALPALMGGVAAVAAVPPVSRAGDIRGEITSPPVVNLGRRPQVAVVQLPGVNCERESADLLDVFGARAEIFRWTRDAAALARYDGYLIPGGFSYQDRVRAGAIAAKDPLLRVLLAAEEQGKPILGICNGAQVLVEAGMVPGIDPGAVEIALGPNLFPGRQGYYANWVAVQPFPGSTSPFVEGLGDSLCMPVAHAEGRFTHEDPLFFQRLAADGYLALRYTALGGRREGNPNGALLDVAGLTNKRGNVLAMMPHPERAALLRMVPEDLPHPWAARRRAAAGNARALELPGPGAALLRRLVELC